MFSLLTRFNVNFNENTVKYLDFNNLQIEILQEENILPQKELIRDMLKKNIINGTDIQKEWFPEIEADIFLSHSHKDIKLAEKLAIWLYEKFGLKTFIDSHVWGYANDLLKEIDDEYCLKKNWYYDYNLRNFSTSHVHMMLNIALFKMMDKCECLFFLNTPNSINLSESMKTQTFSPWIYSELVSSKIIRKKAYKKYRKSYRIVQDSAKILTIKYDVPINHLIELNFEDLDKWCSNEKCKKSRGCDNLDELYLQKGILKRSRLKWKNIQK